VVISAVPRRLLERARRELARLVSGLLLHGVPALGWLIAAGLVHKSPLAAPIPLVVLVLLTPVLTLLHRYRLRALFGVELPRVPVTGGPAPVRLVRWLRSPEAWRQVGYHLVVAPLLAVPAAVVLALLLAGAVAATYLIWIWALPPEWRITGIGVGTEAGYLTAAGVLAVCLAPWLAGLLARPESAVTRELLGPLRSRELARRVEDLTESRAGVVDAADAERRRIERDLHDGAQQRLVSLAVNLGLAKATLTDLPDDARRVIDEAHREAKEAITELSDLVRGLHPPVLEDRGLDAALSGLAARTPVPVRVNVDLPERPPPTVEAVAYFVVSEALANVTKHAAATQVDVEIVRSGPTLRVTVTDDGVGGADPAGGTGLRGLAKRVYSVDGTLRLDSPAGGPTVLAAELPCGR
jgi:signal transduction histidine kinase